MLRQHRQTFESIHRIWDLSLTIAAFVVAYCIKKYLLPEPLGGLSTEPDYYLVLLLCILIWYGVFRFSGMYRPFRKRSFAGIVIDVVKNVVICLLVLGVVLFFSKMYTVSRLMIGIFVLLDVFFLILSKWVIYRVLVSMRKKGYNFRNILIAGCGPKAEEVARAVRRRAEAGYRVVGCLWTNKKDQAGGEAYLPVVGNIRDLKAVLSDNVVDELIIADPVRKIPDVDRYIYEAEQMGVSVHILPEWGLRQLGFEPQIGTLQVENVFGHTSLSLTTTPEYRPEIYLKSAFDYAASALGLMICAVPFLIIAGAIKLASSGPVFFKQERIGKNGRRFRLYKFRTMVDGADKMRADLLEMNEADGPAFKLRRDPRVIPWVGTFLRKTSIDELPQLINVFKGEMSLVGPRPPLPEEIREYDIAQRRRLSMKPGITCVWQTSRRRNDFSFKEWVDMDLRYIDNWSLGLDFRILVKTVGVVLRGEGR